MRKILYLFFIASVSSCAVTTHTVNVEILKAGTHSLKLSPNDRVMVIANYKPNARYLRKKVTAFVDDSLQVASTANLFSDYYRSLGTFTASYIPIKFKLCSKTDSNEPIDLTNAEIFNYTILDKSRYLIDISLLRTIIEKIDGMTYKATFASLWRAYDAVNGSLIREMVFKDSLYYDQYEKVSRDELDSTIASDISFKIADRMGKEFFPYWEEQARFYMLIQDPSFLKVRTFIQEFRWKEVIGLMRLYLETGDKNDAYAASFNIALACEMMGNFDLALKWIEKCKKIKSDYTTSLYEAILLSRQNETGQILE